MSHRVWALKKGLPWVFQLARQACPGWRPPPLTGGCPGRTANLDRRQGQAALRAVAERPLPPAKNRGPVTCRPAKRSHSRPDTNQT
jgi:hypothetical protein